MTKRKLFSLLIILAIAGICIGAAVTSSPYDGTGWNTSAPNNEALHGESYLELQDLRKGIEIRMNKEHETLASSSAGGVHKQGSARAFFQDAAPTTQVDGSAFDSGDLGSLWFDSNASPDNQFNVLTATTPTWTPISTEVIAVLLASSRQFAGNLIVDGTTTLTGAVTANGGITLGDGDDLIGSSTSDITMNTNKFTVAGDTGNTVIAGTATVGGTLGVTGEATLGDSSQMATSAAPTSDADLANKKYVDDQKGTGTGYYDADGSTVFNTTMTSANTFQDLDLSAKVGSNVALVFLEVTGGAINVVYCCKPKGYGGVFSKHFHVSNYPYGVGVFKPEATDEFAYLVCATDSSGILQHGYANNSSTLTIKLVGFIK